MQRGEFSIITSVIILIKVMPGKGSRRKDKRRKTSCKEESQEKII
jgi:hypothetical protein